MSMVIRPLASGYSEAGASTQRRALRGFLARSGSPRDDIDENNLTLRQRSRMLYMAAPIATSAINTNRTKIVGTGLTLKASIDTDTLGMTVEQAAEWQKKTEAEWKLWSENKHNCDTLGQNNLAGLQQLAVLSWLQSGDCFALIQRAPRTKMQPYTLRIHLVEADRVSTPEGMRHGLNSTEGQTPEGRKVYDGVEVDAAGKAVAYYICNRYPGQVIYGDTHWERVEYLGAKTGLPNILPIGSSERTDQYRGVPYLAQVVEPILQMRRYTDSELMAALIQTYFTGWIETDTDNTTIPFNEVGGGDLETGTEAVEVSKSDSEYEMGPGSIFSLKPGEKVVFGNPTIPTTGFDAFTKRMSQLIGAALELPYDVLLKEFNSSYSASRGALLEAWEGFHMKRKWLVDDFCQPLYEIWLSEAVALGRIQAPGFFTDPAIRAAWCKASWIGPVQGSLDPKAEIEADEIMIKLGTKTASQAAAERGGDWESNMQAAAMEQPRMREVFGTGTAPEQPTGPEPQEPLEPKIPEE